MENKRGMIVKGEGWKVMGKRNNKKRRKRREREREKIKEKKKEERREKAGSGVRLRIKG